MMMMMLMMNCLEAPDYASTGEESDRWLSSTSSTTNKDSNQSSRNEVTADDRDRSPSLLTLYPVVGRHIKPSAEVCVADTDGGQSQCKTADSERSRKVSATKASAIVKERGSSFRQASPVPLASEAVSEQISSKKASEALDLNDIYDMCVGQVTLSTTTTRPPSPPSSLRRSRQTSGDPSTTSSSSRFGGTVESKSRHPSSSNPSAVAQTDSGYSGGTTTPYTYSVELAESTTVSEKSQKTIANGVSAAAANNNRLEFVNVEKDRNYLLPPPEEFGDGNPFMIFICLTLLLEHRDRIMRRGMDFNEIAIYFDKLARKHSSERILQRARLYYSNYLRSDAFQRTSQHGRTSTT